MKNVGKITKAMEVVAATKMRKSQEVALRTRPYAIEALQMLRKLVQYIPEGHRTSSWKLNFQIEQPIKKTLLVLVASDRGLAGSFNAQVLRAADAYLATGLPSGNPVATISVLAIGKKALRWAMKNKLEIAGEFSGFDEVVDFDEVLNVANVAIDGFARGGWDRVITISTQFRTALKQEVIAREVLPTSAEKIEETI
ncbi:MAG: F0F1 ATP synthase subunit gamma, partial [Candidatus Ryanbacteria bacterium]|nr:F0F1 ATP synthase subunit gamma [Candidatus Ryanbacteria bacterium]